jgi:cephalosporin hydroxylase
MTSRINRLRIRLRLRTRLLSVYDRTLGRLIRCRFHTDLIRKTSNFHDVTWLGHQVWQSVLDLWTIQEAIADVKPTLLIETGTYRGGSALFYAHLFDLMGRGRVITVDIEDVHDLRHPRVTFLLGSSTSPDVLMSIREASKEADGPIMVVLDSDHAEDHVASELEAYAPFVSPGSFMLVQDGVIDTLRLFGAHRPGPLPAIRAFLRRHPEFEVDHERSGRFLITQHPAGWLRRKG